MFQQGTCNMVPKHVLRNHSRNRNPWMSVNNTQHVVHLGVQDARIVIGTCYSPFARFAPHFDASMASSQMSRCITVPRARSVSTSKAEWKAVLEESRHKVQIWTVIMAHESCGIHWISSWVELALRPRYHV